MLIVTEADFSSLRCRQRTTQGGVCRDFGSASPSSASPSEAALLFLVDNFWHGHHQAHVARARSGRQSMLMENGSIEHEARASDLAADPLPLERYIGVHR